MGEIVEWKRVEGHVIEVRTLKDLCVNSIVRNFERLMLQYETNTVPKKPFKHLQITQSGTLLEILSKQQHYERYMTFLLNSFATEIDLQDCKWKCDDVLKQLLPIAERITNLSLSGCGPGSLINLSRRMVKLKSLFLREASLTSLVFKNIGKYCTSLETFQMPFCKQVTDKRLKALCPVGKSKGSPMRIKSENTSLKSIDIRDTLVSADGIAFILEHFPNMEFIRSLCVFDTLCIMYNKSVINHTFDNFKPYNLKKLSIPFSYDFPDENALKLCCALCPYMSELSVGYVVFPSQLNALSKFTALTKVSICTRAYLDVTSFIEASGKNLTLLFLRGCRISTPALLNYCSRLTTLRLYDVKFEAIEELESMQPRYHLPCLKSLHVENMSFSIINVSKSIRSILLSAPNLEKLTFHSVQSMSKEFVDSLAACVCVENLKELNVTNTAIKSSASKNLLLIFPNVTKIVFNGIPITFQDFLSMKALRQSLKMTLRCRVRLYRDVEIVGDADSWMYDIEESSRDNAFESNHAEQLDPSDVDEEEDD